MEIDSGKINFVIDGQFGSTGKGLLSNYIAICNHVDIAVTNASANAGHTFYYHGKRHIVKHLPVSGIINDRSTIYLCAGAIIDPVGLLREMELYDIDPQRVNIHPRCAIISENDRYVEQNPTSSVTKIASTQSGVGSALVNKINRCNTLAESERCLQEMLSTLDLHSYMDSGCTVLMEVPQGFDLSISSGFAYPYCTSREITVSAAMADAQVHPSYLGKVAVCIRTYPIRVGNIVKDGVEIGYSGPFYPDSVETSWEEIGVEPELTTVTGRVRRVATFSMQQYKNMLNHLRPDYVFLNFANYMSDDELRELLEHLPEVTHLGFGKKVQKVKLNHFYP